ncbi:hypothetical protein Tco_0626632 [Tanacetum coccineum]|uniref:Reverse transcriptase Ty1/copia-type domain-containing protein n=1 Tax=Tanacetum coccineum TaxID=301880 RepID=A0ABQ4WK58_9ASTR
MENPYVLRYKLAEVKSVSLVISTKYQGMIGSLLYLMASRPDIMFSACLCARFQEAPKTSHLEVVKRIFRHIKGTTHLELWYPKGTDIETVVYADSDLLESMLDKRALSWFLYVRGMLFDILVLEETNRSCYIHYRS